MPNFCVNTGTPRNPGRHHEVHETDNCIWMPTEFDDLGFHVSCHGAVRKATLKFSDADGCKTCVPDCNNEK